MSYKVKLNIFEGPLDLLLFLIKREKIDIYDIPIAKITEQYLEYMELMKLLDLEIAGEYLLIASTLMNIKSKMLLPKDEEEEGEEEAEDPREELVRRLLEYKKYKDAAESLRQMHNDHKGVFLREGTGDKEKVISDDGTEYFEASLFDLIIAFRKVLKEVPKDVFHKVVKNKYTVGDKIHQIYHLLAKQDKVYFMSLFEQAQDKDEAIVTFLAILELIKMREILVAQKEFYGEIEIIKNPEVVKKEDK